MGIHTTLALDKGGLGPLAVGRFSGLESFQQLVRDAFAVAARDGWRELVLSDPGFEDWPLGERAVIESLQAWACNGRRMILMARSYDELQRRHPRFVSWRRSWDHVLNCRRTPCADPLIMPSAIWSPAWMLQRVDPERCQGFTGSDPQRSALLREQLDEWIRSKSVPGFPASTLGL